MLGRFARILLKYAGDQLFVLRLLQLSCPLLLILDVDLLIALFASSLVAQF